MSQQLDLREIAEHVLKRFGKTGNQEGRWETLRVAVGHGFIDLTTKKDITTRFLYGWPLEVYQFVDSPNGEQTTYLVKFFFRPPSSWEEWVDPRPTTVYEIERRQGVNPPMDLPDYDVFYNLEGRIEELFIYPSEDTVLWYCLAEGEDATLQVSSGSAPRTRINSRKYRQLFPPRLDPTQAELRVRDIVIPTQIDPAAFIAELIERSQIPVSLLSES